jgi:rhodanese-related sulfurtransferase
MTRTHPTRRALVALLFAAAAWVFVARAGPGLAGEVVRRRIARQFPDVPRIAPRALARALDEGAAITLLDARTEDEFAVSHLRGAVRVDPQRPDLTLPGVDAARPVVVYCAVGLRSARVVRALRAAGRSDVRNLDGGVFAWVAEGLPVFRDGRAVDGVHPYSRWWAVLLRGARPSRSPVAAGP